MGKIKPLLDEALVKMESAKSSDELMLNAAQFGGIGTGDEIPIIVKMDTIRPQRGEDWGAYRRRVERCTEPLQQKMADLMGIRTKLLVTANSLVGFASPHKIRFLEKEAQIAALELDPWRQVTLLDDVAQDIELSQFRAQNPRIDGSGVRVAVLDSGIDTLHPCLAVAASEETCGESTDIPGDHGTHCAGIIASTDATYRGIAPGVDLLNIKVLRANGSGQHSAIVRGIDKALDMGAHVLSMSLGFNHLPRWSDGGHGWSCSKGDCPLCTAVNNAVALDGAVVVVAAGNEHSRAEVLRAWGYGSSFDTELGCPGQAEHAITVGALTKQTFLPAGFSSHGPTPYGTNKPDLSAPGVNISSTVPVPRDPQGRPIASPQRGALFGRKSGSSMATPIVAAAAALAIQERTKSGQSWTPALIKSDLLTKGIVSLNHPLSVVGAGRLSLGGL